MTETLSCHNRLRAFGTLQLWNWALWTSDRAGQDKSRKVRSVGCGRNCAKFKLVRNIASVFRNLRFSATHDRPTTFDTLRSER
jgi:hypothetical protein